MSAAREKFLRVAEAKPADAGRGIVRIDPEVMKILELKEGDIVLIEGAKSTAAGVRPGYPEDANRGVIRMDGMQRRNAGVGIDDKVGLRKAFARPAEKVSLAPTEPIRIMGGEQYMAQVLQGRAITRGDVISVSVMGRKFDFVVTSFQPGADAVLVEASTDIKIAEKAMKEEEAKVPKVDYEDIGGLGEEVRKIREMIELPLRHPELFERLGVEAPKGVLLHGPPGTGKTLLAKAVASETNANFYSIGGPEIMSKFYGESEERLREIFKEAQENAPSIIFIDEIDSIAPKREEVTGEVEKRVVSQLLSVMDGLQSRGKVVVIGATNRINSIDPALRRPGRFDREIEIGVPDRDGRLEILQIHTRGMPLEDVDLKKLADVTHGFVGADLEALAKEAAIRALRRILPEINLEAENIPAEVLNKIIVRMSDFQEALKEVEPSAMREVLVEVPDIKWDDIGGLEGVKEELREAIEWPLKYPELFAQMNAVPPKGLLLYGPPGTGKTLLAKAAANESEANFISVKGPELLNKFVGESEKAIREVFRKARQASPCIIFFDEIDSVAPVRGSTSGDSHVTERAISQFLTQMEGLDVHPNVSLVVATNRPDIVDPALLRPRRFDRMLLVPPPDLEARKQIFRLHTKKPPLAEDVNLDELARKTDGYTGADIASLANTGVMLALREHISKAKDPEDAKKRAKGLKVAKRHFDEALQKIKPMSTDELKMYERFSEQFSDSARPKLRTTPVA